MKVSGRETSFSTLACVVLAVGLPGVALAQSEPGELERIDPGTSDFSPLGQSTRMMPVDLRVSDGFESIYRVTDARGESRFVRRDGALLAVFSRSDYVTTEHGTFPVISAGTRFLIGEPIGAQAAALGFGARAAAPGGAQSPLARSRRVDLRADRANSTTQPAPQGEAAVRSDSGERSDAGDRERTQERSANTDEHLPWRSERDRAARIASLLTSAAADED